MRKNKGPFFIYYIIIIFVFLSFGCSEPSDRNIGKTKQNKSDLLPEEYDTLQQVQVYSSETEPIFSTLLTKDKIFGETEEVLFKSIGHFTVDDLGRVYIVNGKKIEVFDSTANHIKTLGREGRGPGEFSNMLSLVPQVKSHNLYAYDDMLSRITIFDIDSLAFSHTILLNPKDWQHISSLELTHIKEVFALNDSLLVLAFEDIPTENRKNDEIFKKYVLLNHKGQVVSDEIFKYKKHPDNTEAYAGLDRTFFPFRNPTGRYVRIMFDQENNIYFTRTVDFFIKKFSPEGVYRQAIYYPYENQLLNKEEIIEAYSHNRNARKNALNHDFPETWPAIGQFFVDDEKRIWVATITNDKKNYTWWVLDNTGKLITKFKWQGKRIQRNTLYEERPQVKDGFFYIKETNNSTGMEHIVKYKIEFTER